MFCSSFPRMPLLGQYVAAYSLLTVSWMQTKELGPPDLPKAFFYRVVVIIELCNLLSNEAADFLQMDSQLKRSCL